MSFYSDALVQNPSFSWKFALDLVPEPYKKDALLIGFQPDALYVPQSALTAHAYVVGPSNSGKTSRVVVPLLTQLIRANALVWTADCKPDPALWGHIQSECEAAGRRARLFSMQPGVDSEFSLDLFGSLSLNNRSARQIAQLLLGSLGLNTAGEAFFVSQNGGALTAAIEKVLPKALSFRSIAKELGNLVRGSKRYEHAVHALDVLEELADIEALNSIHNQVTVAELLQGNAPCYFCLPVSTELKTSCATTASLLFKMVALASKDLALLGKPVSRLTLAIDEFQEVAAAGDLGELLAQVRGIGSGVSLVLSHQVQGQVRDEAVRQLLKSSGVLIYLAPRANAKELMEWSGERIEVLHGGSHTSGANGSSNTSSWQETLQSGLPLNWIQEVNRLEGFAIAVLAGGHPTPLFLPHHVDYREAMRRESIGFPKPRKPQPARASMPQVGHTGVVPQPAPKAKDTPRERIKRLFIELQGQVLTPGGRS